MPPYQGRVLHKSDWIKKGKGKGPEDTREETYAKGTERKE